MDTWKRRQRWKKTRKFNASFFIQDKKRMFITLYIFGFVPFTHTHTHHISLLNCLFSFNDTFLCFTLFICQNFFHSSIIKIYACVLLFIYIFPWTFHIYLLLFVFLLLHDCLNLSQSMSWMMKGKHKKKILCIYIKKIYIQSHFIYENRKHAW